MAVSTPSMCLRSESDSVHSHTSCQASSLVGAVPVRLSRHPGQGIRDGSRNPWRMASGTLASAARRAARNGTAHGEVHHRRRLPAVGDHRTRRATRTPRCRPLPHRCSPTRRSCCGTSRGSATWRRWSALLVNLGVKADWREENVVALRADDITSTTVDAGAGRADPRLLPARRAAAGPLRARRDAAARGRRDRPPAPRPAPGRVPRPRGRGERGALVSSWCAPSGLRPCDFFMDEPSVMATENALMAAALAPGSTVIHNAASRAPRAGPGAPADADGRPDRGHRLEP